MGRGCCGLSGDFLDALKPIVVGTRGHVDDLASQELSYDSRGFGRLVVLDLMAGARKRFLAIYELPGHREPTAEEVSNKTQANFCDLPKNAFSL